MADALRHARLLHYLLIVISLAAVPVLLHTNHVAATYAGARSELGVLSAFLGRVPPVRDRLPSVALVHPGRQN